MTLRNKDPVMRKMDTRQICLKSPNQSLMNFEIFNKPKHEN